MKVIVIHDTDGHCSALDFTLDNLKLVLAAFVAVGGCDNIQGAQLLAQTIPPTPEEWEEFIIHNCPANVRNGQCDFVEVENWNFRWNPFK